MHNRAAIDLGDLSLTEEERAAIRQEETQGYSLVGQRLSRLRRGGWGLGMFVGAILLLSVASRIPQIQPERTATVAIARKSVHLRMGPSVWTKSLGVIPAGSLLTMHAQHNDGFHRVSFRGTNGYAAAVYLAATEEVRLVSHTRGRVAGIAGRARLRERASLSAQPISGLGAHAPVVVLGFTPKGWVLVWTGRRAGFVWGGLLEDCSALPFRPRQKGRERVVIHNREELRP